MNQILLVDDELLVIEAIKQNIDWYNCGVSEVFLCDNGYQAQKIMEEHEISLVVSDIQMPGIDGIDFAKWVKEHNPKCGVIFLTGYAEFEYAKAAISLGADEYILKPVDYNFLQEKIHEFLDKAESLQQDELKLRSMDIHQADLLKELVQFVLQTKGEYHGSEAKKIFQQFQLDFSGVDNYVIVWIDMNTNMEWEDMVRIRKVLASVKPYEVGKDIITSLSAMNLIAVFRLASDDQQISIDELRDRVADLTMQIDVPSCCYMSEVLEFDQLIPMIRKIAERGKRNVIYQNKVSLVGNRNIPVSEVALDVDYKKWSILLETHDIEQLRNLVDLTIHGIVIKGSMDAEMLRSLYNQFNQVLYYYIGEEYESRVTIIQDKELIALQEGALYSVEGFRAYYNYFLDRIWEALKTSGSNDVITEVKKYIDDHIGEKISRAQIAEYVFLNENYLSRLFHKEVGCSISNYILEKRIALAKKMLVQTKLSVSDIGEKVGYDTTTYFIRIFKQETGKTPNEYRKDMKI